MMGQPPLVSVIIPSYNHAQYIGSAIESVLTQTYENIELIIVDDGSSDNSHDVIKAYLEDPRVIAILNKNNRGQSYVFNRALEVAKGEFVSLLPSDDWYLPRKTELQVKKFLSSPENVGVVYAAGQRFFEDTQEIKSVNLPVHTGRILKKLITEGNFIYPVTPLFKRAVFEKFSMQEDFRAEGEAIYLRIAIYFRFEYVDAVVAVMRDHSYNIGKNTEVMYDELVRYWEWFFSLSDLPEDIRRLEPVALERLHRTKAMQFIGDRRDYSRGRRCLIRAIQIRPSLLIRPKILSALMISLLPVSAADFVMNRVKPQ
jgi:glycosyltransferase involved in cell wall biosynthesis